MNLRNRSLLLLGLIFFAIFIVVAIVSFNVAFSGLQRIDYADMSRATGQVQSSLNSESALLLSTAEDWGWWDETADFAADNNSRYIDDNLNTASLATIRVNFFMVLDSEGKPVYARALSPDFRQDEPVPPESYSLVLGTRPLVRLPPGSSGTSGLMELPGGPMILASTPILPSNRTGPARGTLVLGRYVASGPLQRIGDTTGFTIHLFWQDTPGGSEILSAVRARAPEAPPILLVPINESYITGYRIIPDLQGRDVAVALTMNRDIYQAGLGNISLYLVLLLLWVVMTGAVVAIVMDTTVLKRIERLTARVRDLPRYHDTVPAPVLTGNDELAVLEQDILASRAELLMSERQLRVFVNAVPDPAALYTRNGTILLVNAAFAAYLGKSPEELIGTPVRNHLPAEEFETFRMQAEEVFRKKTTVRFEMESRGRAMIVSHYPVLDADGEVAQFGVLSFDISERKRLENALRQVTKKIALLNTVIFNDIGNKVFVQRGYHELLRTATTDPKVLEYLDREGAAVKEIQSSLEFARQYNDMGISPPRWQDVSKVMLFAVSHLDTGRLVRDFRLAGLEVYADALLERAFFNIVENTVVHGRNATFIRASYEIAGDDARIVIEDDGGGIPPEAKDRIFEKGKGTEGATGLFLAREILSITGMTIRETGVYGTGVRFEITVPKGSYRVSGDPAAPH